MKIVNTTDIPDEIVKKILSLIKLPVSRFNIMIKNCFSPYGGIAYPKGSRHHKSPYPFIVVRVGNDKMFPVKVHYPCRDSAPTYRFHNRIKALVGIISHEIRHLWQSKRKNRSGYYPKTKGKFSEVDAECYALNRLRAWRKL